MDRENIKKANRLIEEIEALEKFIEVSKSTKATFKVKLTVPADQFNMGQPINEKKAEISFSIGEIISQNLISGAVKKLDILKTELSKL